MKSEHELTAGSPSSASTGSVEAAERDAARRFAQLLLDEARWRMDYCEEKNYFILQQWIRKYEEGLVDLLRMIPQPPQNHRL